MKASVAFIVTLMLAANAWAQRPTCLSYADYFRYCSGW